VNRLDWAGWQPALNMKAPFNQEELTMNNPISPAAGSGLRQRSIEDMTVRGFSEKTRRFYIRTVAGFAAFLGRSPDTATGRLRRFGRRRVWHITALDQRQPQIPQR
jgi:hypothetical protein